MPVPNWICMQNRLLVHEDKQKVSSEEENGFSTFELIKTLKATLRRQWAKQLAFKG